MKDNIDKHRKAIYISAFIALLVALSPFLVPVGYVLFLIVFLDYSGPRRDAPFAEAHQRAITTFVESAGFGPARLVKKSKYWFEWSIVLDQRLYRYRDIRLIGLTPDRGDRYFEFYIPRKETLAKAKHRPLTADEANAVAQIRTGKPWVKLVDKPRWNPAVDDVVTTRVIAPVHAQESCLECHQVKNGALLGAFDYWLFEQNAQAEGNATVSEQQPAAPLPAQH